MEVADVAVDNTLLSEEKKVLMENRKKDQEVFYLIFH